MAWAVETKCSAYSFWPRNSEFIFGGSLLFSCSHVVKSYFSKGLVRCFEADCSRNCSDCYYCHNCENCQDCILCFNAKNPRFAVGNSVVGKEEYYRIKKLVLDYISRELAERREVRASIFSIGKKGT